MGKKLCMRHIPSDNVFMTGIDTYEEAVERLADIAVDKGYILVQLELHILTESNHKIPASLHLAHLFIKAYKELGGDVDW